MISLDRRTCLAASLALAACNLGYAATTWPVKPVRLMVPAAAGTAPDIMARLIGEKLGAIWARRSSAATGQPSACVGRRCCETLAHSR
jgi:tripartite-type tricarboxylate transporter receptor subunit TctC